MPFEAFDATHFSRKNMLKDGDWALCIGAGVCSGLMPDWALVTRQMMTRARKSPVSQDDIVALQQQLGWSLDSLLQHALNVYLLAGRGTQDFYADLADELYGKILDEASKVGLRDALTELLSDPYSRNPDEILELESFFHSNFRDSSVMQLTRFLLRAKRTSQHPIAILTFNADVLLHICLTLLQIRDCHATTGGLNPDFYYRAIYRSTDKPNGKTPIYHIHGSITPRMGNRESREKLVFPESSYSQLAASVYSWPQTVFLSTAQASRMLFVGLSMSDPNIRRWLSWCEGYRREDIAQMGSSPSFLSQHLWITTPSSDGSIQSAKESGLLHLGVRTAFIPSWNRLEDALLNLFGL